VVAKEISDKAEFKTVKVEEIPDGWIGVDIGPQTISRITSTLNEAKSILWNGPVGVFETPNFATGTNTIARTLAGLTSKGVITIVGGGDTTTAVAKLGLEGKMSHVSTGGGASLELLEGLTLPGVAALDNA